MITLTEQGNSVWLAPLFAAVAILCVLADILGESRDLPSSGAGGLWRWSTALLWLMAANLLIQGDQLFVTWMRETSRAGGWYELRRPLQVGAVAVLLAASAITFKRMVRSSAWAQAARRPMAERLAASGVALLVLIVSLRFISMHYTDWVLNARLAGASLGRWLEMAGLVLVGAGALQQLLRYRLMRA